MTAVRENETSVLLEHLDLMSQVARLLASHPAGASMRVVNVPAALTLAADEVLVQRISSDRSIVLDPVKAADLQADDVLWESQTIDPNDEQAAEYGRDVRAASCLTRYNTRGTAVHVYD